MVIHDSGEVPGFGSGGGLRLCEMTKLPPLTCIPVVGVESTRGSWVGGDFLWASFLYLFGFGGGLARACVIVLVFVLSDRKSVV